MTRFEAPRSLRQKSFIGLAQSCTLGAERGKDEVLGRYLETLARRARGKVLAEGMGEPTKTYALALPGPSTWPKLLPFCFVSSETSSA